MKALKIIGINRAIRYFFGELYNLLLRVAVFSPLRILLLRLAGAQIGEGTVICDVKFFNLYRTGFKGLHIGKNCFIGEDTMIDLADHIYIDDNVTIAPRTLILTHINVGYPDHPLQKHFPSESNPVFIKAGGFIGANTTILSGITIGEACFITAGAVVNQSIIANVMAGGVPAKIIRDINDKKI